HAATFTVRNNCPYTIWPATVTGGGPAITTGFELPPQAAKTLNVPPNWSGRVWSRYQCSNSGGSGFRCGSGDCGSGQIECNSKGGIPPATLVEFTLGGYGGNDFYDVSLVDGFNLPVSVQSRRGGCPSTSCPTDINARCPGSLAVKDPNGGTIGCKSACLAFGSPQYCCTPPYGSPATCGPSSYSKIFKGFCPQAYSYAFDDKTSTFTCPTGGDYLITFCP
ncbi:hypothetical protein M569_01746, partial [Genlisea aurea]